MFDFVSATKAAGWLALTDHDGQPIVDLIVQDMAEADEGIVLATNHGLCMLRYVGAPYIFGVKRLSARLSWGGSNE